MLNEVIPQIFKLLDITIIDLMFHCDISERTAYRWFSAETAPTGKQRERYIELLLYKLKQLKHLNHNDGHKGIVKFHIQIEDLLIVHSEPFIHPLFKANFAGHYLSELCTQTGENMNWMTGLINFVRSGQSVCFEHCLIYNGVLRIACAWLHPLYNSKGIPMVKYEEAWYDQFELPCMSAVLPPAL